MLATVLVSALSLLTVFTAPHWLSLPVSLPVLSFSAFSLFLFLLKIASILAFWPLYHCLHLFSSTVFSLVVSRPVSLLPLHFVNHIAGLDHFASVNNCAVNTAHLFTLTLSLSLVTLFLSYIYRVNILVGTHFARFLISFPISEF